MKQFAWSLFVFLFLAVVSCGTRTTPAPNGVKPQEKGTVAIPEVTKPGRLAWQVKWDNKVAAAKQEGEVLFYFIGAPDARKEVAEAFSNRFGIKVEFVAGLPGELAQKIISEQKAGLYLADAINMGATTLITVLKPQGLLKPIEPELILPEVKDPQAWQIQSLPFIDKNGMVLGMLASYGRFVTRNTDLVKEGEITSFEHLLNPKWKGKMVMLDPTMVGTGTAMCAFLGSIWGVEKTSEFLRGLARQETAMTRDKRMHVEWIAKGKYAIGIAPVPDEFAEFMALGSPLAYVSLAEGGSLSSATGALSVPARPAHPNASTVLLNWLLSKDGQAAYVKGIRLPSMRVDVPTEGIHESFFVGPGDKVKFGDEEFFLLQSRMMLVAKDIFTLQ